MYLIQKHHHGKKTAQKISYSIFELYLHVLRAHRRLDVTRDIFSIYPRLMVVTEKYFQRV